MIVLPIVERELRVAARRRGTHWMRIGAALVAILVFGWMTLTMIRDRVPSTAHGIYLFRTLFGFAFFYCLFIGARVTADCLSEEKREGTLGLLFLTDLKGYDVVLGKLVATSINSVYSLLAIIPVIWLTIQLGGITIGLLWQAAVVLLNTLLFSLSAGIFVSTLSRHERKAMMGALLAVLMGAFGPLLLLGLLSEYVSPRFDSPQIAWKIMLFSPLYPFGWLIGMSMPAAAMAPFPAFSFWFSVLVIHLLSWMMLGFSSRVLPWIWQTRTSNSTLARQRERVEQWTYGAAHVRKAHRSALLDLNPFLWLAERERWKRSYVWLYLAAVAGTWCWGWFKYEDVMFDRKTLIPTVLLFQTFLKIWVTSEACNRLAEDQRSGALELLLSTPLSVGAILRGQWLALRRQFAGPLFVILVLEWFVLRQNFSFKMVLANQLMLIADVVTLGWVGMWLGLTSRNTSRAILGAVLRILVLPWAIFYAGGQGLDFAARLAGFGRLAPDLDAGLYAWLGVGLIGNFIFGFHWARRNLQREFRVIVTQRYQSEKRGWLRSAWKRRELEAVPAPVQAGGT
jgi:ABC-type Na+ efflux pump permease subunit